MVYLFIRFTKKIYIVEQLYSVVKGCGMRNSGDKRKTVRSSNLGVLHVDRPSSSQAAANVLLFPFYCTKSLIISLLLVGVPYGLFFSGNTTLVMLGGMLFWIFIPLFLGFAVFASNEAELPEYPPLKDLVLFALKSIAALLVNGLPFLVLWIIVAVAKSTNFVLISTWLSIGALSLYLLPKSLVLLGNSKEVLNSVLALKPAFTVKYLIGIIVSIVVGAVLLGVTSLILTLPFVGGVLGFLAMIVGVYYFVVFVLSFLADRVN